MTFNGAPARYPAEHLGDVLADPVRGEAIHDEEIATEEREFS